VGKKWPGLLGKPLWVVADGAYAKKDFLKPAKALGMTVVSRLRRDAALWSRPPVVPADQRGPGRPRVYGTERISRAKRAGQRRGWTTEAFTLYGERVTKRYKTFLATWRPAGGVIRVVLVDETTGWRAYFCTDPSATVAEILTAVADRFSLEITFRDCKEVVGAGQQQVRFVWASFGAFHVCLWTFTMTEAWAWGRPAAELVDRSDSPWDSPLRRPSHADKRRAWRRALLGEEIRAVLRPGVTEEEIQATAERLLRLAA
jgi:DDE superfamily endonuclease